MMLRHQPIDIINLSLSFPEKACFLNFSARIHAGSKIGIIGSNGSGKSTLLKMILGTTSPSAGNRVIPADVKFGHLPQNLSLNEDASVWQTATEQVRETINDLNRFETLSQELAHNPMVLDDYDVLLERLTSCDAFNLANTVESLLESMDLAAYKDSLVRTLSGGQRMHLGLVGLLVCQPNVLLLDEPTNHLDSTNRDKLITFINEWQGTLLTVSHDINFLKSCFKTLWHIQENHITVFDGTYDNYMASLESESEKRKTHLVHLKKEQRAARKAIQKEQVRAVQSRKAHAHENDRKLKGYLKMKGNSTAGLKKRTLEEKKRSINEELSANRIEKIIQPTFELDTNGTSKKMIAVIQHGEVRYKNSREPIICDIHMTVCGSDRIAIQGDNASGKSTFVKALLQSPDLVTSGTWALPKPSDIGYLDQHYALLMPELTVFEIIKNLKPIWPDPEVRTHLNRFLFSTNEMVFTMVKHLSDGEKARLCLAYISAQSPQVLILDEMTNNLDLIMREHVIEVLRAYPGTLVVISHDHDFLEKIHINRFYKLEEGRLIEYFR